MAFGNTLGKKKEQDVIKPRAKDLEFDFTLKSASICLKCSLNRRCKIASLLNVPVISCRFFKELLKKP